MRTPAATSTSSEERTAFGWVGAVVLLAIFGAEILGFAILRQNSQELLHQGVTEWL